MVWPPAAGGRAGANIRRGSTGRSRACQPASDRHRLSPLRASRDRTVPHRLHRAGKPTGRARSRGDVAGGLGPFQLLGAALDRMVMAGVLPEERRPGAEYLAWSAVHCLAMLFIEGPLRELPDMEEQVLGDGCRNGGAGSLKAIELVTVHYGDAELEI